MADIRCDGHRVRRSQKDIDEQPSDTYCIYLQGRGRVWFEQQDRRCVLEPGDMVIADPNIPFSTGTDQLFDFRLWRVQRRRALLARVQREITRRSGEMDLTPERMASAFGMSLRALHQLFALSDLNVQEFLTKARLERAQTLLRAPECGHLSTAEIGFEAGFAEVSTFYRRFRQRHGMTPGEWRAGTASAADFPAR